MTRKSLDCRRTPSASNCTLTITGEEDEVLDAGVAHAIAVHGHDGDEGLRDVLRDHLVDADLPSEPGAFVQLFEFRTRRIDELAEIQDRFVKAIGDARTTRWSIVADDRDADGTHVAIVEFPSYERAMANSDHPETGRFVEELRAISEGEPTFRNLDVRRVRPY
jgi:hypothetical protein